MGQAAKRNQQRQRINRQQESATNKPEVQTPKNLDERHRDSFEALCKIPELAEILDKVKRLPPVEYSLSPDAKSSFSDF